MKKITLLLPLFITCFAANAQTEKELTKQQAIDSVKLYYANFSTGSDQYSSDYGIEKKGHKPFRKFTGNYKVEITDCKFKMTFDTYKWPYEEMQSATVIEFDLSEVDSITQGAIEIKMLPDQPGSIEDINGNILFYFKKNKKATALQKFEKDELLEMLDEVNLKIIYDQYQEGRDFTDIKIVKVFERLRELCNSKGYYKKS